jgi:hypothetical protein
LEHLWEKIAAPSGVGTLLSRGKSAKQQHRKAHLQQAFCDMFHACSDAQRAGQ